MSAKHANTLAADEDDVPKCVDQLMEKITFEPTNLLKLLVDKEDNFQTIKNFYYHSCLVKVSNGHMAYYILSCEPSNYA